LPTDSNLGRVLDGKYELTRVLGVGGMGVVYEAHHRLIDRRFALKLLRAEYAKEENTVRRFEREATTTAAIGHENIVGVTDMGVTEQGELFIVMELLEGTSLAEVLRMEGAVSRGWACHVACQILRGLQVVHEHGIVHRDLKPGNIIILGGAAAGGVVKLVDFGIAKVKASEEGLTRGLTRTGELLGTPWYMSPEQARGETGITGASDIYSVGVILYQMLAGALPFDGSSYVEVLMRIITEEPAPPSRLRPGIDPSLEEAVLTAMDREPARRFRDPASFYRRIAPLADPGAPANRDRDFPVVSSPIEAAGQEAAAGDREDLGGPRMTAPLELVARPDRAASRRRAPRRAIAGVAAALAIVAGVTCLLFFGRGGSGDAGPDPPTAPASSVSSGTAPIPEEPRNPAPVDAGPPLPREATLRLRVRPAEATVAVDGNRVQGIDGVFDIRADGLGHKLEVTAPGHAAHSRIFMAAPDASLEIALEEDGARARGIGQHAPARGGRPPEAQSGPPEPPADPPPAEPPPAGEPEEKAGRKIDKETPW